MDLWMPGVERLGTAISSGTLVDGPPRCTWHITYDKVIPQRPLFINVAKYLVAQGFEPTLQWDPLTGRVVQFIPANRSAKALKNAAGGVETNRLGKVHIQIEAFFTPGMVVGGVTYPELTDTPMLGLAEILAWTDSLGIPRTWATPRGSRDVRDWLGKPGHRGHYNVPENDHKDPVGADVHKLLMLDKKIVKPKPTLGDLTMDLSTSNAIRQIIQEELQTVLGTRTSDKKDTDPTHVSLADLYTQQEKFETAVDKRLLDLENAVANSGNPPA